MAFSEQRQKVDQRYEDTVANGVNGPNGTNGYEWSRDYRVVFPVSAGARARLRAAPVFPAVAAAKQRRDHAIAEGLPHGGTPELNQIITDFQCGCRYLRHPYWQSLRWINFAGAAADT